MYSTDVYIYIYIYIHRYTQIYTVYIYTVFDVLYIDVYRIV